MNQTNELPPSSMGPDSSGQEFSRANLFGMFVTLQLCQLTQPYGSLLFRGSSGFLWRVNPIASFVEASMIAFYLLRVIWDEWREGRGSEMAQCGKKLRATASALLLLRGALEDEDGGFMEKLMAASVLGETRHAQTQPATEFPTPSRVDVNQDGVEAQPGPNRMPDVSESYEMGTVTTQSDSQDRHAATAQQGVLRRRTSQLESAPVQRTNTITGPDPSTERSRLLRAAFGPNAIAHSEWRIDIVTTLSVLTIFVKLLTIRSLWIFLTAAHFIVYSWLLVQTLLLIFHSREMSDLDMASSVRAARLLDAALKESCSSWHYLYMVLHLPFLGYLCYALVYLVELPSWLSWVGVITKILLFVASRFIVLLCIPGVIVCIGFALVFLLNSICMFFVILCRQLAAKCMRIPQYDISGTLKTCLASFGYGILGILLSLLVVWVGLGSLTYNYKNDPTRNSTLPYEPLFGISTLDIILDSGFTASISGVGTIFLFFVLVGVFSRVLIPDGAESRYRVSWGNFLLTVVVFIYCLVTYDSQGSYKPTWTEYLG